MGKFKDRTGDRVGRLIVESFFYKQIGKRKRIYWHCVCDCGGTVDVEAGNLGRKVKSCGCLQKESRQFHNRTHGMSGTRTHKIWKGMRKRCGDMSDSRYGGRGIMVCPRWTSFELFLSDMGEAPKGKSIERTDNDLGYSPENCIWADKITQANNTRANVFIEHNGQKMTISQWAEYVGVPYHRLYQRLFKLGWEFSKAIIP